MNRIAFLDRDGVLNRDDGYVYEPEQFKWMPGAIRAIAWLNREGFKVVVVTNQSGVARGYYTEAHVKHLHEWMTEQLLKRSARIDDFYYCPHHPTEGVGSYRQSCACRKPKPGMILDALRKYKAEPSLCFLLGDSQRDMTAAHAAGITGVLYEGGSVLDAVRRAARMVL